MDLLRETPPVTLAVLALCISFFLLQNALDIELRMVTMSPRLVIYTHEYYRVRLFWDITLVRHKHTQTHSHILLTNTFTHTQSYILTFFRYLLLHCFMQI